jgi:hypothetical protein
MDAKPWDDSRKPAMDYPKLARVYLGLLQRQLADRLA